MAITNPGLEDGFDLNGSNLLALTTALKDDGYSINEIPKSGNINTVFKELYRYIQFLKATGISQWDSTISYEKFSRIMRNGIIYSSKSDANQGNDPLATLGANWDYELGAVKTGQKNLIINPRKTIQQRVLTGGTKQVIEANMNVGGNYTLSFTGTATATIYEYPALLADEATTIADIGTNTLGTAVASGTTVTATAGYYIQIVFSTTVFDNVQFEKGSVVTDLEIRHNEKELCQIYYEIVSSGVNGYASVNGEIWSLRQQMKVSKRVSSIVATLSFSEVNCTYSAPTTGAGDTFIWSVTAGIGAFSGFLDITANSEIFNTDDGIGINYKEDRWFI